MEEDSSSYLLLANVPECLYCRLKVKCCLFSIRYMHNLKVTKLGSRKLHICSKVSNMDSITGHRIRDYNRVGAETPRHIPSSKNDPSTPSPCLDELSTNQCSKEGHFRVQSKYVLVQYFDLYENEPDSVLFLSLFLSP